VPLHHVLEQHVRKHTLLVLALKPSWS
jgi:hypothetical protein